MLEPPSCFRCSLGKILGRTFHGSGRRVHWRLVHWEGGGGWGIGSEAPRVATEGGGVAAHLDRSYGEWG